MAKRRPKGDGMIRKRKDTGRWEGRIVVGHKDDGSPIHKYVYADTQKDLIVKFQLLKEQYAGMELTEQSKLTLGEWLDKWLTEIKEPMIRASTAVSYHRYIDNHIKTHLGNKKLTSVRTADIQKMYNTLQKSGRVKPNGNQGEGLSNATVRSIHMLLHEAMDGAVKEGLIPSNPTDGTTIPKLIKKSKPVLLESQIATFMSTLGNGELWHDLFYMELMTGMRRGEICGLKWSDFDEEQGAIIIERSVDYKERGLVEGETKTKNSERKLILPPSVAEMLRERKKNAITEWIFPKPDCPEQPVKPGKAYSQLKIILEKANLPNMRFHDLRHTFATHAASNGIDPKTLSNMLGHAKASFTLDTYTHVTTDMQRNASDIVGNFITDMFGEELKPWQENESQEKAQ